MRFRSNLAVILWMTFVSAASAQTNPLVAKTHADNIVEYLRQLRWRDQESGRRYVANRDDVTRRVLAEVDAVVTESFSSDTAAPAVKDTLDRLFGYDKGMLASNSAFLAGLPTGRFLIVGIEVPRGGEAISEDAVSFRAYREERGRFAFVASTESLRSSDVDNTALTDLHVHVLEAAPARGEVWFAAWAMIPPRSPYTVAISVYSFNGEAFRSLLALPDVVSMSVPGTITFDRTGFVVNKLVPPAPGTSPALSTEVTHDQFVFTADGPQKISEWRTPIQ